jgi:dynein heavy chain
VWQTVALLRSEQAVWTAQRWVKLDSKQLSEDVLRHIATINALPPEAFAWDVLIGLNESTLVIQVRAA